MIPCLKIASYKPRVWCQSLLCWKQICLGRSGRYSGADRTGGRRVLKTGKGAQGSGAGVQLPSIWRLSQQTNEWRPGTAQFILMPRWEQCHWLCSESQDNRVWFMTASLQSGLSPLEMLIYKSQKLLLSSIVSSCGFIIFFSSTQQDQKTKLVCWLWCGINPGVGSCFSSLDELSLQMGVTTSPLPSPS